MSTEKQTDKITGKKLEEEKKLKDSLAMQYSCTKYCRCCPFPGLKCVESGHPVH